jgi:SAM-dependent methyltransferase
LFGIGSYDALDPFDGRAKYRYDLGRFVPIFRRYDVISNFGTAEHVFDIANVFRTAHRLLRPGGILLNVLPAQGDVDHGFYNIHPVLFRMMAAHAGYEICDLQYIDDIARRTDAQCKTTDSRFDFDALPLRLADMADGDAFKRMAFDRLATNLALRREPAGDVLPPVFDYCFAALRKVTSGRYRAPYQYTERPPSRWANAAAFVSGNGAFGSAWRALRGAGTRAAVRSIRLARRLLPRNHDGL